MATLAFVVLAFVHEFPFAVFVSLAYPITKYFRLRSSSKLLMICLLVLTFRKAFTPLFPMNLANTLSAGGSEFKQLFSVFGVDGVEFIFLVLNFLIFLILDFFRIGKKKLAVAGLFSLTISLSFLYFLSLKEHQKWQHADQSLEIALYQPGDVIDFNKNFEDRESLELKNLHDLDEKLASLNKADILILPETYIFSYINTDSPQTDVLKEIIASYKIPILSGGHSLNKEINGDYNNIFLMNEKGELVSEYYKRMLMPVGEFKPFRESFPLLSQYMPGRNLYLAGKDSIPIASFKDFRIGLAICYEDLWKRNFKEFVDLGADFVVSISSDHQFHSSVFAQNHLNVSAAHALSVRLPFVRLTNTGISAAFDSAGNIVGNIADRANQLKLISFKFSKHPKKTFYYIYEQWQFGLAWLIVCLSVGALRRKKRTN